MKFYAHRHVSQAVSIKEVATFEAQGGLAEPWGKSWTLFDTKDDDVDPTTDPNDAWLLKANWLLRAYSYADKHLPAWKPEQEPAKNATVELATNEHLKAENQKAESAAEARVREIVREEFGQVSRAITDIVANLVSVVGMMENNFKATQSLVKSKFNPVKTETGRVSSSTSNVKVTGQRKLPVRITMQKTRNIANYFPHLTVENNTDMLGVAFSGTDKLYLDSTPIDLEITLIYPGVDYSTLKPGTKFSIMEGSTEVGSGVVLENPAPKVIDRQSRVCPTWERVYNANQKGRPIHVQEWARKAYNENFSYMLFNDFVWEVYTDQPTTNGGRLTYKITAWTINDLNMASGLKGHDMTYSKFMLLGVDDLHKDMKFPIGLPIQQHNFKAEVAKAIEKADLVLFFFRDGRWQVVKDREGKFLKEVYGPEGVPLSPEHANYIKPDAKVVMVHDDGTNDDKFEPVKKVSAEKRWVVTPKDRRIELRTASDDETSCFGIHKGEVCFINHKGIVTEESRYLLGVTLVPSTWKLPPGTLERLDAYYDQFGPVEPDHSEIITPKKRVIKVVNVKVDPEDSEARGIYKNHAFSIGRSGNVVKALENVAYYLDTKRWVPNEWPIPKEAGEKIDVYLDELEKPKAKTTNVVVEVPYPASMRRPEMKAKLVSEKSGLTLKINKTPKELPVQFLGVWIRPAAELSVHQHPKGRVAFEHPMESSTGKPLISVHPGLKNARKKVVEIRSRECIENRLETLFDDAPQLGSLEGDAVRKFAKDLARDLVQQGARVSWAKLRENFPNGEEKGGKLDVTA